MKFGHILVCCMQGLIQKEKVLLNGEKGAQISILANKIAIQLLNLGKPKLVCPKSVYRCQK